MNQWFHPCDISMQISPLTLIKEWFKGIIMEYHNFGKFWAIHMIDQVVEAHVEQFHFTKTKSC